MKQLILMILALAMLLSMAACGQKSKQTAETVQRAEETLAGGWTHPEDTAITDEARAAFDKALEGFTGVAYEPVALIGTQVVAGMNYCFLCKATTVYPGAQPREALVYIYADLQGNAEITDIVNLDEESEGESGSGIANPFVDYASLAEAAKAAGFDMTAPETVEGYEEKVVQVMNNEMIQVIFLHGDSRLFLRKAAGDADISGDYNSYSETKTAAVGGSSVTLKGDGGLVKLATWTKSGYTYAVMADEAMTPDAMTALVAQIA